jgi:hypothetical protein
MTEFQPEDTWPTTNEAFGGPAPYQGMPALQGQPFDPRQAYGQQPPAYGQAAPPAPAYGQAAPPAPAYGQMAPPAPAYGQAPPPAPAYGQAPPMPAPPQNPAWGAPPPIWNAAPAKKRKVWPWVVGGVGALVVLGGVGALVVLGVIGATNADQNEHYTGDPITAADLPALGDKVVVSADGAVAFEIGDSWVDATNLVGSSAVEQLPEGATYAGMYFTSDPATATDHIPTLVMILEGAPSNQVGPINLQQAHDGYMSGALDSAKQLGADASFEGPNPVTTAHGLDGLVSGISGDAQGVPIRVHSYTFVRSKRVVWVEVSAYTVDFDDATAALITDSLRIDK